MPYNFRFYIIKERSNSRYWVLGFGFFFSWKKKKRIENGKPVIYDNRDPFSSDLDKGRKKKPGNVQKGGNRANESRFQNNHIIFKVVSLKNSKTMGKFIR